MVTAERFEDIQPPSSASITSRVQKVAFAVREINHAIAKKTQCGNKSQKIHLVSTEGSFPLAHRENCKKNADKWRLIIYTTIY